MEKEKALQIWERLFKDKELAYDFASHPMKKEDFQNHDSHYGWDIDFKKPYLSIEDNYLPCSLNTISFRQGKTTFKVGNNLFEVRRGDKYGTFSIYDITDRNNPINTDPTDANQDPEYNKRRFHLIATSSLNPLFKEEHFMIPTTSSISEDAFMNRLKEDEFDNYTPSEENTDEEEMTESSIDVREENECELNEDIDKEFSVDYVKEENKNDEFEEKENIHELIEDESLEEEIVEEQHYENNALTPKEENEKLNLKIDELQKENERLKQENITLTEKDNKLNADINQMNAQSGLIDDQLDVLNLENEQLTTQLNELKLKFDEKVKENDDLKEEKDSLYNKYLKTQEEKNFILEEKERLTTRTELLSNKIAQVENERNDREQQLANEKTNSEFSLKNKDDTILSLQVELDKSMRTILLLNCFGDPLYINEIENKLNEFSLPFNEENVKNILNDYPQYKRKETIEIKGINGTSTLVYDEEIKETYVDNDRKEKAYNYYSKIYGEDKSVVSDFSGRFIKLDDYLNIDNNYGWDYKLINPNEEENIDNVFIANIKSLKEYKFDSTFESNDHTYKVIKENNKYKISSDDFISDPYDFSQAMRITKDNLQSLSPVIYIFIKVIGLNTAEINNDYLMEFFSLLDRTVKRCCPQSFIELKSVVGSGKGNYALITFDGTVKESYKEALDYSLLLNSYRREFRNEEKLNAVIVLNELMIPYSKRHFDFDELLTETKDAELRALRYEFNMSVINSTIKRTIHIGPKILDKLAIDQTLLKPSQIGTGNFSKLYNFNKEFKVYNFVYSLSHKEENIE